MEGRAPRVRRVVFARGQSVRSHQGIRGRAERVPPLFLLAACFTHGALSSVSLIQAAIGE